jgi:Zn-finger nucleic acid-binding protein
MDLSRPSSSDAYRHAVVRCPGCAEPMRREIVPSAELEVCDACEGLWVDWFDGDVSTIAVEAESARLDRGTPLPSRPSAATSVGPKTCPRCQHALVAELYRFSDARNDDLIGGVELLRCAECAGAFVPRGSAHLLLDHAREARTQSPWEALLALLRRLFARP